MTLPFASGVKPDAGVIDTNLPSPARSTVTGTLGVTVTWSEAESRMASWVRPSDRTRRVKARVRSPSTRVGGENARPPKGLVKTTLAPSEGPVEGAWVLHRASALVIGRRQ